MLRVIYYWLLVFPEIIAVYAHTHIEKSSSCSRKNYCTLKFLLHTIHWEILLEMRTLLEVAAAIGKSVEERKAELRKIFLQARAKYRNFVHVNWGSLWVERKIQHPARPHSTAVLHRIIPNLYIPITKNLPNYARCSLFSSITSALRCPKAQSLPLSSACTSYLV